MDDLETKLEEYKPSSLEVGFRTAYEMAGSVVRLPLDYAIGFLPNEVRMKLYNGDEKKNKRSCLVNSLTQLIIGSSAAAYGVFEEATNGINPDAFVMLLGGIGFIEAIANGIRLTFLGDNPLGTKDHFGHPLFTIPYHLGKKAYQRIKATEQKVIDERKNKILTAKNNLLLEDKAGSLSHPEVTENQGMLSLPKYTLHSYDDEEHF